MNNLISTNQTLSNVISKLGLRSVPDLPFSDMVLWMSEAIAHIGSFIGLEETKATVRVVNYTGKWPRDMYAIKKVVDHPRFISKRTGFNVSLESGEVEIVYDRLPVDEDGFPMVSSDPSTQDAIMWRIAWFLAIQGKLPNAKLSPGYCESQWQWYCSQARAEGYAPSIDQWERMVNVFYQLIPDRDQYAKDFEGLNQPESLNLDAKNNQYGSY